MTSTLASRPDRPQGRSAGPTVRRVGYAVAAVCNGVLLWAAHQLLDWGWPGFLTEEFDELLPIVTLSFVASIVVDLVFIANDPWWLKSAGSIVTSAIGFVVAVRTYQVFPFDFSTYSTDWSWLVRMIVIVAIVGSAIGMIVEVVKLATGRASGRSATGPGTSPEECSRPDGPSAPRRGDATREAERVVVPSADARRHLHRWDVARLPAGRPRRHRRHDHGRRSHGRDRPA